MARVSETPRSSSRGFPAGATEVWPDERSPDDWLGEVSDDDWSEGAAERARRPVTTEDRPYPGVHDVAGAPPPSPRKVSTGIDRRAIERRRIVAVLGIAAALGIAIAIPVVLLRGGSNEPAATTLPESTPAATTPASTETSPSTTTTAPEATTTTPSTTTTTPSESAPTTFSLPEGTKLKLGEGDPAIVEQLQQALASAGYDPGTADGTFGPQTESAVVAFQQANGLTADGTVGPLTASALASAIATG